MSVTFEPVETQEELELLAELSDEIWHEYWPTIIGPEQTDYMVAKFQSLDAIKAGIAEQGYRYWLVCDSEASCADSVAMRAQRGVVGYTGGYTEADTNRFFISKIYLLSTQRGKGLCSKTIAFYEQLCRDEKLHAMYLTVNKHNELGIRAYKGKGFETIDAVETDIGNGFVMDDYIMEKAVDLA